ncbi:hypothetical protein MKX01_037256 [Papaver californicum]|nr:hypothetical protein MKX01_037256 [Papaver californicum]
MIKDDKYFIDLYHTRSKLRPCLVLSVPTHRKTHRPPPGTTYTICRPLIANRLIADLCEGVVGYDGILKPVNGLICFTDTTWDFGVRIYNLGNRELTPWMSTTFMRKDAYVDPKYQFGFDPATKEHKVICLWKSKTYTGRDSDPVYVGCEVLTVGDNTWRIIDIHEVPQFELVDTYSFQPVPNGYVYVNGSIYWITGQLIYRWHSGGEVIVAFDVGSEKFRTILVPKFITDQIPNDREYMGIFNSSKDLLEVSNRVALYCRLPGGHIVKLWILDCDDVNKKDISASRTTSCNQNWTGRTIELPFQWDNKRRVVFHGIPGTDEILIETYKGRRPYIKCLSLMSYNWKSMTFRKVESDELNYLNSPGGFRKKRSIYVFNYHRKPFSCSEKFSRRRQGR